MDETGWSPAVIAAYIAAGAALVSAFLNGLFASQLKRRELANAEAVTRLSNELTALRNQKEIMFRGLQERRAQAVADIYAQISEFTKYALKYAYFDVTPKDKELYENQREKVFDTVSKHRILFTQEIDDKIWAFLTTIVELIQEIDLTKSHPGMPASIKAEFDRKSHEWKDKLRQTSVTLLRDLQMEFRRILGCQTDSVSGASSADTKQPDA